MPTVLLMAALLLITQEPQQTGVVAGSVVPPEPVHVILLGPGYVDLWANELQRRLDLYWQQYQVAFGTRKELFSQFARQAHRDATNYVFTRMQLDLSGKASSYIMETSTDGKFEFKNLPFGEYKILAFAKNNQELIWQESVDVRTPIPYFLELRKRIP